MENKIGSEEELKKTETVAEDAVIEQVIDKLKKNVARKVILMDELSSAKILQKDLEVITCAKKLGEYIIKITEKSPKKYRWSVVGKFQNTSIELVENLYYANFESGDERLKYLKQASIKVNMLGFFAETAKDLQAINFHQMSVIANMLFEIRKMLNGWIRTTKRNL